MKRIIIFFLLTVFPYSTVCCQPLDTIDVQTYMVKPAHYIIPKSNALIKIDGLANEGSWQNTGFTKNFIDIEGIKKPKFDTRVKMLWDNNYLYIYAELEEPHIWGNIKERDDVIYYNNDFEVFIDPSGQAKNYGEIEINALNTVWDLYLNKPYRVGGFANFHWNLDQLKSAVKIYGTLNKPDDIDSLWTMEMAIPLEPLIQLKNRPRSQPKEGEQWRMNFSRVEWDFDVVDGQYDRKRQDGIYKSEYNWVWSNQKVINMHEPEKWGYVQFTQEPTAQEIVYRADEDQAIKQALFALFRQTKNGKLKRLLKKKQAYQHIFVLQYGRAKYVKVTFNRTNFGFEYGLKSPISRATYFINEEGVLKENP